MAMDLAVVGPPLAVLGVGLGLGFAMTRGGPAREDLRAAKIEARRTDLRRQREEVVAALKALDSERSKLEPAAYDAERERLLAAGAQASALLETDLDDSPLSPDLKAALEAERARLGPDLLRDALGDHLGLKLAPATATSTPPSAAAPGGLAPEWRGFFLATLVFSILGGLVFVMQRDVAERGANGSMTGKQLGEEAAPNPEIAALEARIAKDPADLAAMNELTEISFGNRDLNGAMRWNAEALKVAPQDADARVFHATLQSAIGRIDEAIAEIDGVLVEHPGHTKGLVYKAMIALEAGRPAVAIPALKEALAKYPQGNPFLESRLKMAEAMVNGEGAPAGDAVPAPPEVVLKGTITAPAGFAAPAGAILYVSARPAGGGGPPLAALKLAPGPFPLEFTMTSADAIAMGGAARPFPDTMDLAVRVDADGNAMTKEAGMPAAALPGVAKGTADLQIALQ